MIVFVVARLRCSQHYSSVPVFIHPSEEGDVRHRDVAPVRVPHTLFQVDEIKLPGNVKTKNIVFIAMIAILLSMVSLYATGHSGHCGKCKDHSEIEEVEVTGTVTKTDTCLTLTEQGKETVLKLVFSEEMEAKADSSDS